MEQRSIPGAIPEAARAAASSWRWVVDGGWEMIVRTAPSEAVRSATAVPAEVLGLGGELGSLRAGLRADAVVVNSRLGLYRTMRSGEWLAPLS